MHPAALSSNELLGECEMWRGRRSGPGGQHRNKVETAVALTHRPTGVRGEASERRSQAENRAVALFRLRLALAVQVRTPRGPAPPSPQWQRRVRSKRLAINPTHEDFPALLAEALDTAMDHQFDVPAAARQLGISTSQFVKLIKLHPAALTWLNERRRQFNLGALK